MSDTERADKLRIRGYTLIGHGYVKQLAEDLEKSPSYISNILSGRYTAEPSLDLIEKRLDEIEAENAEAA